jgi:hypothetical protein
LLLCAYSKEKDDMLITINNSAEIENVWNKMGFYCQKAKLINRTLVVDSLLTIEETEEVLKEFDIKIRKLPTSYKFSPDQQ